MRVIWASELRVVPADESHMGIRRVVPADESHMGIRRVVPADEGHMGHQKGGTNR